VANLVPRNGRIVNPSSVPHSDPLDLGSGQTGHIKPATEFAGIREYIAMVLRHWFVFLGILALSVGYTVNNARKERPVYRAASTVRLVDSRRTMTGDMSSATGSEVPFSYQVDPIESQIQVLHSEAVATVAVDLKGLRLIPADKRQWVNEITDVTVANNPPTDSVSLAFDPAGFRLISNGRSVSSPYGQPAEIDGIKIVVEKKPSISATTLDVISRESAIANALGGFQAAQRGKTDIIDLSYTGAEPYQAQRVANAMAEAFQVQNASAAQELSRRRRIFLQGQLHETDSALAQATGTYSAFRSGNQIFNPTARGGAQEQSLVDLDTRRAEMDAERRTDEALLAQARQGSVTNLRALVSSPGISQNPVVTQLYAQLTGYIRARDSLLNTGAAPTNPDVIAISGQIQPATDNLLDAAQSQIQSLSARISALDRLRATGATKVAAAPATESQDQELSQQVQAIRLTEQQLQSELQKAKMSEAVEAGQVQIIQLATSPGYQIATGQSRKVLLGLLVGLMLGFGAAVLADTFDASIRKRSDIERLLGIPSLAVIPRLSGGQGMRAGMMRALPGMKKNGQKTGGRGDQDLVTINAVRSQGAEAIRTLRTNLMFSQSLRAMRTIVVTSASPGEGKTTTASNLAVSFAQQGMRVLLLDADLRRARLHRMFSVPREPGLSDLVLGFSDEEAVTRSTSIPGLYLIPAGKLPPNPAELLGGDGMRDMMSALTEGYDLIVIDTPPLLAASDAAILATLASGVILVLRAGATENTAAQQSVQQLNSVGARIIGAVLNDPDTQVPKYGAYYEYEYAASAD
jgi:polysaccharide biosynthesis transport protein